MGCVGGEGLGNLQGELAGGGEYEHLGVSGDAVNVGEFCHAGECGQREGCGFAGTGLCQTHHIVAVQQQRDGLFLDGGRFLVADFFECGEHSGV